MSHTSYSDLPTEANQQLLPGLSRTFCRLLAGIASITQHVAHPIHKKNADRANSHFSIDSLKEVLDSPRNRAPKEP